MEFQGCYECGKDLPEGRKRKYCNRTCGTNTLDRRWPKYPPGTDKERLGRAAEMLVASDLLKRHEDVLLSLNPHGTIDLVVLADKEPLKIEVKIGHLTQKSLLYADTGFGKERRTGRQESDVGRTPRFDILAVVLLDHNEVIYEPEPEKWGKERYSPERWRQRSKDYTGTPNRRVIQERTWVRNGRLHVEFEQDGMSLEMMLRDFPELAQLSDDEANKMVVRNGYWLRWPRLQFEINVTDFLRVAPTNVQGRGKGDRTCEQLMITTSLSPCTSNPDSKNLSH